MSGKTDDIKVGVYTVYMAYWSSNGQVGKYIDCGTIKVFKTSVLNRGAKSCSAHYISVNVSMLLWRHRGCSKTLYS